jgi:hypothetical protein
LLSMFILSEMKEISHAKQFEYTFLLEKNIGSLTEAMYHGGSFNWTNPQSLMRKLLAIKNRSPFICFSCRPGMDVPS